MNASAAPLDQGRPRIAGARAEHISIEGDPDYTPPARDPHRITLASYTLTSRLHGCSTELAILEGWYLGVRCRRPASEPLKYQLDLRFANPRPVRVRRIAWTWLIVCIGLAFLGVASIGAALSNQRTWLSVGALGGALAVAGSMFALFLFLRRTTEALEFRSAHGEATLFSVVGGVGSARAGKKFFVELIKAINAAKLARPQSKQQFLRDEMREHHRLRERGVLTEQQYEESKAKILAAH